MAIGVDLSTIGDKELARDFALLEPKVQKKLVRKAIRPAAKVILQRMKQLVPRDEGDLRRSLKVRAIKRTRKHIGVNIESDKRYAFSVETGSKRGNTVIPPQSFMRQSADERKAPALFVFSAGLRSIVDEAMRGP